MNYLSSCIPIMDAMDRKRLEETLLKERNYLSNLISLCPDGIIAVDRLGQIIVFNKAAERITGYSREEAMGKLGIMDIYNPPDLARKIKKKLYSTEMGGPGRLEGFEAEVVSKEGKHVPIRISGTLIYEDGKEVGSVGFFHDLTAQKEMERKLRILSVTDGLTGLYNHRHFYTVLEEEVSRAKRYQRPLSLICFDVDNFKDCNDTLGHLEGDNILRLVGRLLRDTLRRADSAYRYGGDEFMILLPETALVPAHRVAEKIQEEFRTRWPYGFIMEERGLKKASLSMGLAQMADKDSPETFIKRVDMAMYEAKKEGGDRKVEARDRIGV